MIYDFCFPFVYMVAVSPHVLLGQSIHLAKGVGGCSIGFEKSRVVTCPACPTSP